MSYSIGQYNHVSGKSKESFLNLLSTGYQATRYPAVVNSGVTSLTEEYPFDEECLCYTGAVNEGFLAANTYYLHCRILQLDTNQTFNIKLVHMNPKQGEEDEIQFLKRIVVQKNNLGDAIYNEETKQVEIIPGNNWVDLELVFTPVINFDCLVFDLNRSIHAGDFSDKTLRYPCIIFNELSIVQNPLEHFNSEDYNVIKIGVQSHPGLFMSINNEPIKIGKSGTYELRSELLKGINSFSVLEAAYDADLDSDQYTLAEKMTAQILIQRKEPVLYRSIQTGNIITVSEYEELSAYRKLAYSPVYVEGTLLLDKWSLGEDSPSSLSRMDNDKYPKTRKTSDFVLDYMYEENKENE